MPARFLMSHVKIYINNDPRPATHNRDSGQKNKMRIFFLHHVLSPLAMATPYLGIITALATQ